MKLDMVIENWGVPIGKEELHENQIFQFGQAGCGGR
jgi:hypothetical protein